MKSSFGVRRILVAVLTGVLVGGGLLAVTPAGAEVATAAATNWKKIWKKNLKPLADKRYYTKAQSDTKYATKTESAAGDAASNAATDAKLGNYYKKSESDAKYAGAGSSYTKAESDAKYAPVAKTIRGTFALETTGAAAGTIVADNIAFGVTLSAPPAVHYIPSGATPPLGCSGTVAAPSALPGHLCIFESLAANAANQRTFSATGSSGTASPFGINVAATTAAAGNLFVYGSWAVAPAGFSASLAPSKDPASGGSGRVEGK